VPPEVEPDKGDTKETTARGKQRGEGPEEWLGSKELESNTATTRGDETSDGHAGDSQTTSPLETKKEVVSMRPTRHKVSTDRKPAPRKNKTDPPSKERDEGTVENEAEEAEGSEIP